VTPPVPPGRWERVKEIVADALELPRGERADFVGRACAADVELRHDVETLLAADDPDTPFLTLERIPERAPERLGPYRIVREIGRGGMGTVYLAERDDGQFEQRVAVKIVRAGLDSEAVVRRFYAERQILARLQHPNITRLLDGGTFESKPYFVMEYIEGEPLVAYCGRTHRTLKERIALFLAVCDAVEHAHRNLILHRDLKAGNILVDAAGTPKLLDFGIAKLLEDGSAMEQTLLALRPMTPETASPEQIRGEPLTTASDVYSLGMLLFELLVGQPAYRVRNTSPAELVRTICEAAVPRPSVAAGAERARQLRGDLDNIVLKSLEKEPARRYQRASELAEDLRRYLSGLPVEARAGGAAYRARKFVGRHRKSLAIAAVVALAIAGAAGDAILQGRRASRRFEELRQLSGTFLFEFHDAIAPLPGATAARELVEKRALQYLDSLAREASGDTDLKLELAEGYARIGDAQGATFESNLGKTREAQDSYRKAAALFAEVARARPRDVKARDGLARARVRQATTYQGADRAMGLDLLQKTAADLEAAQQRQPLDGSAQVSLAMCYFGSSEREMQELKSDQALGTRLKANALLAAALREDPENREAERWLAQSLKRLGFLYLTRLHQPDKAAESLQQALAIDRKMLDRDPGSATAKADLALTQDYLSAVLWRTGDHAGGLRMLAGVVEARAALFAADARNYRIRYLLLSNYVVLGGWLRQEKREAEALAAFQSGAKVADGMDPLAVRDADAAALIARVRKEAGQR
jgi:tRNA A-37 threonylcarbamoyl transferase component Bud32